MHALSARKTSRAELARIRELLDESREESDEPDRDPRDVRPWAGRSLHFVWQGSGGGGAARRA